MALLPPPSCFLPSSSSSSTVLLSTVLLPKLCHLHRSFPTLALVSNFFRSSDAINRSNVASSSSSSYSSRSRFRPISASFASAPLDLTEDNVRQVLVDARTEFAQIFDVETGMTGVADLAELDGPYVKLRLKGRFWHTRATVLARLSNYLKTRIPEILEVEIEDEKQLDDSPENF